MGKVKTVNDYVTLIVKSHNELYHSFELNESERVQVEKKLKRQLKAWSDLVMVVVYSPGNEQNPWTFEELGYSVKRMELKKESGVSQTGDYHTKVCVIEATDTLPATWKLLDTVVERKGGIRSKKSILQFNWDALILTKVVSPVLRFINDEFKLSFVEDDVNVMDSTMVFIANTKTHITLSLTNKNKTLLVTRMGAKPKKYSARKVKGNRNIYKVEYRPGIGGPHDLYGSLYGSTVLKDGKKRYHRDRLHEEIQRFKEDDRFSKFWLFAECTRSDFMSYSPVFTGKERNKGYGANVESRKASIASIAYEMGSPVNWCGTRQGAIDDFKNLIQQTIIHDYVQLLDLDNTQ